MVEIVNSYQTDIHKASSSNLPWDKLSGKNILITGSTGLIGSCIIDILMTRTNINYHVYASGRNVKRLQELETKYKKSAYFHTLQYDVTNKLEANITFHYIIAAASGANPILYSTDPVGVMRANLHGTDNLLSYGIKHGLEKYVFISSGDVYGENDGQVLTEDYSGYVNSLDIRSCYTLSKRATETLCISYANQYSVDVCIARPCHVYGPHFTETDTRVYTQFLRNVLRKENIVMKSKGEQFRSWCYVVDAAIGILYVLLKGKNCEAYNIADENSNITIKELAEMIADFEKLKVQFELPSDIEEKGYNRMKKSIFDSSKLKKLGWEIEGSMQQKMLNTLLELKKEYNEKGGIR